MGVNIGLKMKELICIGLKKHILCIPSIYIYVSGSGTPFLTHHGRYLPRSAPWPACCPLWPASHPPIVSALLGAASKRGGCASVP